MTRERIWSMGVCRFLYVECGE